MGETGLDIRQVLAQANLPQGLSWAISEPVLEPTKLFPEEAAAVERAVPGRQAEFTGGRVAARKALWALGIPPAPIKMGSDRAPGWPEGVTGSISHAEGMCIAFTGASDRFAGIGIDIEPDVPLEPDLVHEICSPQDLQTAGAVEAAFVPKRIFSAKEAVFKAHFALAGTMFGFHALSVNLSNGTAWFADTKDVAPVPPEWRIRLRFDQWICDGMILSLCTVPHPGAGDEYGKNMA